MENEELKEEIISLLEDEGFDFDYEEAAVKDDSGDIQKELVFKIEMENIPFMLRVIIKKYTETLFSDLLFFVTSSQLWFDEVEQVEYLNILKNVNKLNYSIGGVGHCCYIYEDDESNKKFIRLYGHTLLPDCDYKGLIGRFIYRNKMSLSSLINTMIDRS